MSIKERIKNTKDKIKARFEMLKHMNFGIGDWHAPSYINLINRLFIGLPWFCISSAGECILGFTKEGLVTEDERRNKHEYRELISKWEEYPLDAIILTSGTIQILPMFALLLLMSPVLKAGVYISEHLKKHGSENEEVSEDNSNSNSDGDVSSTKGIYEKMGITADTGVYAVAENVGQSHSVETQEVKGGKKIVEQEEVSPLCFSPAL